MEQSVTINEFTALTSMALFRDYIKTTSYHDEASFHYIILTSIP